MLSNASGVEAAVSPETGHPRRAGRFIVAASGLILGILLLSAAFSSLVLTLAIFRAAWAVWGVLGAIFAVTVGLYVAWLPAQVVFIAFSVLFSAVRSEQGIVAQLVRAV